MRRGGAAGSVTRAAASGLALVPTLLVAGCAAGRAPEGPPLADPVAVAERALARGGPEAPQRLRFEWQYADERGPVKGDGVLRYTPPDSLRLDLFGPGDGSMAVALVGEGVRSVGKIRDVGLPPAPFLYGTAGIFRPERGRPDRGYRSGEARVLVYFGPEGTATRFRFLGRRLVEIREGRDGRWVRRLEVEWEEDGWPRGAEYRDREVGSRARWDLRKATIVDEPFDGEIYDLPRRARP